MDVKSEVLCALTMLLPTYESVKILMKLPPGYRLTLFEQLVIFNCILHLPFSVALHISRALGDCCYRGKGLIVRRLDYTFIFVSSTMLSFGLSKSYFYGTLAFVYNAKLIHIVWNEPRYIRNPPVNEVAFSVGMYIFGLLLDNRGEDFKKSFFVAIACYLCTYFDTIGFAMMHFCCAIMQHIFLSSFHIYLYF